MLAVQHTPRMGSSHPPSDPFMPFGYSIDPNQEPPLFDAPDPAPGAPLLSDNDNKLLSSFFEDMTADHYNMPSIGESGLFFSESWLDLPPQFMGSTSSFGQQPSHPLSTPPVQTLAHGLNDFHGVMTLGSNLMPPPPVPPHQQQQQQQTSEDVLHAAATLLHNGSAHRHSPTHSEPSYVRRTAAPTGTSVGQLRHQPMDEFREDNRRDHTTETDNTYADWVFGGTHSQSQARRTAQSHGPPPLEFQWGSDASFHRQGYMPSSERETSESLVKNQLKVLECFETVRSVENTRPNSPLTSHVPLPSTHGRLADIVKAQQEAEAPPRKRRKSREVPEDDADDEANGIKARRRKGKTDRLGSVATAVSVDDSAGKRRKSGNAAAKAARENLSEEQKRENHIRSEQKRRTLIKEGFDDLCELVPGLRGGGFSKSTMLAMAADWLDDLLKGNQTLALQLSHLERR